ncbi:MAG TPA: acetyl-CoA carboxylase biotin carboxyl carrier protein subunit [Bacteroidales bacterium]|nr:acetyl-CoA carboxylase biotin carboxyl carrier protein subunit [Bacteroidales bacterium]HPS17421.1 acetyl-CoA carboxylase biotin carboxyl carrier protein subunit [Bacteroidales bacterium]
MENEKDTKEEKEVKPDFQKFVLEADTYKTLLSKKYLSRKKFEERDWGAIKSFIPGTIITVEVKEKQKVNVGERLLVLEAMKMHNIITSPIKGTVKKIHVKAGDKVANHQLLVEIR